jgi:EAL domain-containing protein (putative c-di-GMP-specific phosphodiesterase class I)
MLAYPEIVIIVLVITFFVVLRMGWYFMTKSVKTAEGTVEKDFCGISRIKNDFEEGRTSRKNRCVMYISISLDSMKRLYSESKAIRMQEQIKKKFLNHFCFNTCGDIAPCGGTNFVVINELEEDEITQCIDKCFEEINEIFAEHGAAGVARVNFGYYLTSSTEVSFETALERAKQACSMAEDEEVLYCRWDNVKEKEFERKIRIESNIQNEIEDNRFFLEYQPFLDAETNKIVGAEVLSRLHSPTEGILTPGCFLSAVNNIGASEKFDYYIFEKNCKWIASDKENRTKYVYTINFSRQTLCDQNLAESIINIIEKYDIDYSCIAVEILNDISLNEYEKSTMIKNLIRLKGKGVLIFLDDFGKYYTSFNELTDFDISIVKVDTFVTQNAINPTGFSILKNMISTAHDLGLKTLCKGIETEEHKKIAIDAGSDMLQGYYFYHPMSVMQLEALLEKQ